MTKTYAQSWQIARRKARGSNRERATAFLMFKPDMAGAVPAIAADAPDVSVAGDTSAPAPPSPKEGILKMTTKNSVVNPEETQLSTEKGITSAPAKPEPNVSHVDMRTKITVSELLGEAIGKMPQNPPQTRWFGDFYGELIGYENVTERGDAPTWYGPYRKWLGRFRAFNRESGEWIASAALIVPAIADAFIDAAWKGAAINLEGRATDSVMLGFRLGVTNTGKHLGSDGYRYVMRVIEPARYERPAIDRFIDDAYGLSDERIDDPSPMLIPHSQDAAAEAAE